MRAPPGPASRCDRPARSARRGPDPSRRPRAGAQSTSAFARRQQRNAEDAARRGAHRLGIPGAHGSRQAHDARSRQRPRPSAESCPDCRDPECRRAQQQRGGFSVGPSTCAQVQSGGSTSAAIGCGVSVASAESSSFFGISRTSVSAAGSLSSSFRHPAPQRRNRRAAPRAEPLQAGSALRFPEPDRGPARAPSRSLFGPARAQLLQAGILLTLYNANRHRMGNRLLRCSRF
jgi:hypothetical protein